MRPQVQIQSIRRARFRRAPSTCQRFWQGILILATLALAIAASAQSKCEALFAVGRGTPAHGRVATIRYSFDSSSPEFLLSPSTQGVVIRSIEQELQRVHSEAGAIHFAHEKLSKKSLSKNTVVIQTELDERARNVHEKLNSLRQIESIAGRGSLLTPQESELLSSQIFEDNIPDATAADQQRFAQRVGELKDSGARIRQIIRPPAKFTRVLTFVTKHWVISLTLAGILATGLDQGYGYYVEHIQNKHGPIVQVFDQGQAAVPLTHAEDDPAKAIPADQ